MTLTRTVRAAIDLGCRVSEVLACIGLFAIAAFILAQIVGRMFGAMVPSAVDFAAFAMAGVTFLGLAGPFRAGGHIRVLPALKALPERPQRGIEILNVAAATLLFGFVTVMTGDMTWVSYQFNDVSIGLVPVPLWIPQLMLVVGSGMATIVLLEELVLLLTGGGTRFTDTASTEAAL